MQRTPDQVSFLIEEFQKDAEHVYNSMLACKSRKRKYFELRALHMRITTRIAELEREHDALCK